tara:strand:- start:120 stop:656 length:537 start_codon:yes stop_codon:yes gene_type:complete
MIDSDLRETIEFIKERHKIFLEKKAKEKEQEFKKSSYLDLAETKKDLKYLVKAKDIVTSSIEKVTEKGIDLEYDDEVLNELTKEVFEKIKPIENKDPRFIVQDNIHKGNYHSRDTFEMLAGKIKSKNGTVYDRCWEVLDNEYKYMNIDCNADSGDDYQKYEFENLKNSYQALSLGDII